MDNKKPLVEIVFDQMKTAKQVLEQQVEAQPDCRQCLYAQIFERMETEKLENLLEGMLLLMNVVGVICGTPGRPIRERDIQEQRNYVQNAVHIFNELKRRDSDHIFSADIIGDLEN